jgi:hypothetical protein
MRLCLVPVSRCHQLVHPLLSVLLIQQPLTNLTHYNYLVLVPHPFSAFLSYKRISELWKRIHNQGFLSRIALQLHLIVDSKRFYAFDQLRILESSTHLSRRRGQTLIGSDSNPNARTWLFPFCSSALMELFDKVQRQ